MTEVLIGTAARALEDGRTASAVIDAMAPPVHFTRKASFEAALKSWSSARLERVLAQLFDASLEARRTPSKANLGDTIAQRALFSIALNSRRRE